MKTCIAALSLAVTLVSAKHHNHHHHGHHHYHDGDDGFLTRKVGELEQMYVQYCQGEKQPHGYYGAFLEPCEFAFFDHDQCQGVPVVTPTPMNWVLNLTQHYQQGDWDKIDWDKIDWDDISSSDDVAQVLDGLLLWPDQCVGVEPKCYSVSDPTMEPVLSQLFQDHSIPAHATHVRVDCRVDALAVSRTIYAVAHGLEVSTPKLILWASTLLVILVCSTMWCFYGCFYLCCGCGGARNKIRYYPVAPQAVNAKDNSAVVYVALENGDADEKTKTTDK